MAKLRLPNWKDPRTRARLIVWLLTLLTVVVAMSVSAMAMTSRKQFCSLCHEMAPDLAAFGRSAHASISCYGCHMPAGANPGIFVLHKVEALKELYLHFTNSFEKPINGTSHYALAKIGSAECNQCHSTQNRIFTLSEGIIMDHAKHAEKKVECPTCHNRVAHPGLAAYEDWMKMEACFRCHTQEAAEKTKGAAEAAEKTEAAAGGGAEGAGGGQATQQAEGGKHEDPEIAAKFDFTAPGACTVCHPKDFELKPADHLAKGWLPKGHHQAYKKVQEAQEARKRAEEAAEAGGEVAELGGKEGTEPAEQISKPCEVCHARRFCVDCHGMEQIPHPADFKQTHKELSAEREVCGRCHGGAGFCNRCHHANVPTIKAWLAPSGHPAHVKKNGAEGCFKCHDPRLCETCHIRGKSDRQYL